MLLPEIAEAAQRVVSSFEQPDSDVSDDKAAIAEAAMPTATAMRSQIIVL